MPMTFSGKGAFDNTPTQVSKKAAPKLYRDPKTGLWKPIVEKLAPDKPIEDKKLEGFLTEKKNISKIISSTAIQLAQVGVKTPREDAVIILSYSLGISKVDLLKRWETMLTEEEAIKFDAFLKRRLQREPIEYLTGTVNFFGNEYVVDKRVLIPRPETELLVQEVIAAVKGWNKPEHAILLADIGTGSGIIAVSTAIECSSLKIYAVDVSQDALDIANVNAYKFGKQAQITFLHGNLLDPVPEPVHLIAANLPYVSPDEYPNLEPEITHFEPIHALVSEKNGLAHIGLLLAQAPQKLILGGKILLEIGSTQKDAVVNLVHQYFPYASIEIRKDVAGLDRVLIVNTG